MAHALHELRMHVKEGFRALIVCLDSNCAKVLLGETGGGTPAPKPS